jgi:chromosome segregation protein
MPLRLKQLELHGYKTFATKTEFAFSEGISAIVGPNGSGKSNIVDSIRWVLGEQSFGLLRGKKTEDMIFAGSELRPRAGMAQATLTFDNSDGWLPIDYGEVSIARRAYRDGENEYLLNGQRVRLRDISELLARCGLAERTYTIIGQGLIDTALSLKAEERRALFEEAAGIGGYRNKREEALRKLETTQHNLERVLDILAEIKPRLRSLERQAQRARDYHQVKDDLHAVLKLWYGYHWHRAVAALDAAGAEAEATAAGLAESQSHQENYDQEVAGLRARLASVRSTLAAGRAEDARLQAEREGLARELAVADERQRSLASQRTALEAELPPLQAQLTEQAERALAAATEADRLAAEAEHAQRETQAAQAALAQRESQRADLRRNEAEARAAMTRLEGQLSERRAQHAQLEERRARLAASQEEQQAALRQLEAAEARARATVQDANVFLNAQQSARAQAEAHAAEQAEAVRAAEGDLLAAGQRLATAEAEAERVHARHEVLEHARAELAGFSSGARTLLKQGFPTRGALGELLSVPPELERAIGAALGAYLEALVIGDYEEVAAAIAALGEANGRAALLPLQRLNGYEPISGPRDDPDVVGVAARLLAVDDWLRPAANLLLGHVLVVRDSAAAQRLASSQSADYALPRHAIVVTLNGEVYGVAGPVLAGREAAPSMLEQARERRTLAAAAEAGRQRVDALAQAREAAAGALTAARQALVEAQSALRASQDSERRATVARDSAGLEAERVAHDVQFRTEQLQRLQAEATLVERDLAEAQAELARLAEQRQAAEGAFHAASEAMAQFSVEAAAATLAQWQTRAAVAQRARQDAQARAAELERSRAQAEALLAERQAKLARLDDEARAGEVEAAGARAREAELHELIDGHAARLRPLEAQLAELEAEQTRVEAGDAEARATLHAAERRNNEAQLEQVRRHEELEGMRRRIEEDFGLVELEYGEAGTGPTPLPLYPVVERLEVVEALPEGLEDQLNRKRGQLRRMGLINPEAEREYLEVKERHEFLTTQVADLEAAQVHLREVIAEMDVLMDRDFRKTFDAVANEFRETFAQLFGGGSAKLLLTDPEHVSTTGVDIQARLPGRRPQSLAMLSGGERSLTACALVFALLRVSPTPFCVLDEVDAMLDEANVGRYREMLLSLTGRTQFIIITHNRNTVQVADTVYGISMGADSASQAIGLKLEGEKIQGAEKTVHAEAIA